MSAPSRRAEPGPSRPPAGEVSAVSDQRVADLVRLASSLADRTEAMPLPTGRAEAEQRAARIAALREASRRGEFVLQQRATSG